MDITMWMAFKIAFEPIHNKMDLRGRMEKYEIAEEAYDEHEQW